MCDVSVAAPPEKLALLQGCMGREMGDQFVVPILVPSGGRAA